MLHAPRPSQTHDPPQLCTHSMSHDTHPLCCLWSESLTHVHTTTTALLWSQFSVAHLLLFFYIKKKKPELHNCDISKNKKKSFLSKNCCRVWKSSSLSQHEWGTVSTTIIDSKWHSGELSIHGTMWRGHWGALRDLFTHRCIRKSMICGDKHSKLLSVCYSTFMYISIRLQTVQQWPQLKAILSHILATRVTGTIWQRNN